MLCYELEIAYEKSEIIGKELEWGNPKRDAMEKLNAVLFAQKDEKDFRAFAFDYGVEVVRLAIVIFFHANAEKDLVFKFVEESAIRELGLQNSRIVSEGEIATTAFVLYMNIADEESYLDRRLLRSMRNINLDGFRNRWYKASEEVVEDMPLSKAEAIKEAEALMGDQSLLQEIDRIYDDTNMDQFYGF